jgi:hypothetical protein
MHENPIQISLEFTGHGHSRIVGLPHQSKVHDNHDRRDRRVFIEDRNGFGQGARLEHLRVQLRMSASDDAVRGCHDEDATSSLSNGCDRFSPEGASSRDAVEAVE